jgi:hypothetical protein
MDRGKGYAYIVIVRRAESLATSFSSMLGQCRKITASSRLPPGGFAECTRLTLTVTTMRLPNLLVVEEIQRFYFDILRG